MRAMNTSRMDGTAPCRRICTPDAFARETLLHVQEIGELAPAGPMESRRSGMPSLLFLLVEDGEGTVREGTAHRRLRAGNCALLDCRGPYGHATGSPPWRLRWIHFFGPGAPAMLAHWRERAGGFAVRATSPARYRRLWDEVWDAVAAASPTSSLRANDRLSALFTLLSEDAEQSARDRRTERLAAVRDWIDAHCAEPVTLDRLAEMAHLNKYTLVREFHARYGLPPNRALAAARVDRAKRLLRFTDDTVEAVGAACGVPDPNYFARLFRRVEGLSPRAFRRQWRE